MLRSLNTIICSFCAVVVITGCSTSSKEPQKVKVSAPAKTEKKAPVEPAMPVVREFAIGQPGTLGFLMPGNWIYAPGKITSLLIPAAIRVDDPDKLTAVQVNISWDGIAQKLSTPTEADLELKLRTHASYQHLRTSVEGKIEVKSFKSPEMIGRYAQFTEAQWTNVEVPKGVYPVVTEGVFRCGNLWGTFTIYSQSKSDEGFLQAFAMVRSFRKL